MALDGSRDGSSPHSEGGGKWGVWAERQVRGQWECRCPIAVISWKMQRLGGEQQERVSRGVKGKVAGVKPAFWKLEK